MASAFVVAQRLLRNLFGSGLHPVYAMSNAFYVAVLLCSGFYTAFVLCNGFYTALPLSNGFHTIFVLTNAFYAVLGAQQRLPLIPCAQ